jgi:hypothetical protein
MGKSKKHQSPKGDSQLPQRGLLAEISDTGFVGMWKDREDIGDSAEFARRLRERAQAPLDPDPEEK